MSSVPARNELDEKLNRIFAGKVVRKDLVRKEYDRLAARTG